MKYNPQKIERKWQRYWHTQKLHEASDLPAGRQVLDGHSGKPAFAKAPTRRGNFMLLVEFPYPSGDLHVGHWYAFSVPDIYGRYLRMNGFNVMYPIGFDAFGLPAENAAIKRGIHPGDWTKKNIKTMSKQLRSMGAAFDWSREVQTIDPEYYKWTQWIFLKLYEAGLAYRAKTLVNWCPHDKTVLANEQVINGKCDRCGNVVVQRELAQWMFKITSFADRLVDDLNELDWPESTKLAQKNWIGRSEGAKIEFTIKNLEFRIKIIEVFTTRADTIFGAMFIVISPEVAQKWIDVGWQASEEVKNYLSVSFKKTELQRQENLKDKTGVDTGIKAINPASEEEIPVWVADYVLGHYGTGAIMAVPAHDERDFEFATKFNLSIKKVIESAAVPFEDEGVLVNSGPFNGLTSEEGKKKIIESLKEKGLAELQKNYRLHDWILSRQRYWGAPIPMIHCPDCGYQPVPEKDLPVKLPPLKDFMPADDGRSPLAKATKWLKVKCPKCGAEAERETDTMDTFVDSSWYYLRYADPHNDSEFASHEKMDRWLPSPLYFGGAEHNTMHLLYSRFITKALRSLNLVDFSEPFLGRRNHGLIMGPDGQKMSKSKGNVVDPDQEVEKYGADAVRMYLAFMGPYNEINLPWNPQGPLGIRRFLDRFWNFAQRYTNKKLSESSSSEIKTLLNRAAKEVADQIKQHKFNTGVSHLMKLLNSLEEKTEGAKLSKEQYEILLRLIAPFAPHMAEELWSGLQKQSKISDSVNESGQKNVSIHIQSWPEFDETLLVQEKVSLIVQINGRMRDTLNVPSGLNEEEAKMAALESENVKRHLGTGVIKKVVYVQDRLINFVV
jgi:leucyl-tRNA synthetase